MYGGSNKLSDFDDRGADAFGSIAVIPEDSFQRWHFR